MNYERVAGRLQQKLAEQFYQYEGTVAILTEEKAVLEERVQELEAQLAEKVGKDKSPDDTVEKQS